MGWSDANEIFDPVARVLIDRKARADLKAEVLSALIGALQDSDWDTESESLDEFQDDPAIVAAFRERGIFALCDDEHPDGGRYCSLERGHRGTHGDGIEPWRNCETERQPNL